MTPRSIVVACFVCIHLTVHSISFWCFIYRHIRHRECVFTKCEVNGLAPGPPSFFGTFSEGPHPFWVPGARTRSFWCRKGCHVEMPQLYHLEAGWVWNVTWNKHDHKDAKFRLCYHSRIEDIIPYLYLISLISIYDIRLFWWIFCMEESTIQHTGVSICFRIVS